MNYSNLYCSYQTPFKGNYSCIQLNDITCNFLSFYSQPQGAPDCFAPAVQDFRADTEDELMVSLAKLSGLSHAKKDHLIHSLWSIVGGLRQEVGGLREQAVVLKSRRLLYRPKRPRSVPTPPSLRLWRVWAKRVRYAGGVSDLWGVFPDTRVPCLSAPKLRSTSLSTCRCRSARLAGPGEYQARQVFDLSQPVLEVTEHRAWQARCVCGHHSKGYSPTR